MTKQNKNKIKVPNLRFPEFKEEWEEKTGNEIFASISDKNHTSELPILAISQEHGAIPRDLIDYKITVTDKSISSYKVVRKGNFIISLRSFQGGIEYSEYDGICSPAYVILKSKIEICDYFFKYYLKTDRYILELNKKLEGIRDGKMISYGYFSEIKLPYPSLVEQERIGIFLTLIDERIQLSSKLIKGWESFKGEIIKKIFSGQIKFKDNEANDFSAWQNKTLGEITTIVNKKNKDNEKFPVYSINNKSGFIPQNEQFEGIDSNSRGYNIQLYKIINKNTFAYNPARINVGSIGYSGDLDNIIISSLYVCFRTNSSINDYFLLHYLKTDFFKQDVLKKVEGGVRDYLFYENFAKISLSIPCIVEQLKIATFLSNIDNKIDLETALLKQLKLQKKYLLQQLFI